MGICKPLAADTRLPNYRSLGWVIALGGIHAALRLLQTKDMAKGHVELGQCDRIRGTGCLGNKYIVVGVATAGLHRRVL